MKQKTVAVTLQLRVPDWWPVVRGPEFVRRAVRHEAAAWARDNPQVTTIDGSPPVRVHRDRVEAFAP